MRHFTLALATTLVACNPPAAGGPPLVLIVLDTVRADRLGCYGYERATSPAIDRLAADSVVFENAVTPAPLTMPAMAALMTGLYPDRAGVISHSARDRLDGASPTLAELASRAGYRTAAVVTNPWLANARMGFDRGFQRYVTKRSLGVSERLDATSVTDEAIAVLDGLGSDEPYLLWVHYMDAHMPYSPPPELAARFGVPSATSTIVEDFRANPSERQRIYFDGGRYSESELAATRDLYDASIRHVDENLGRLLAAVAARDDGDRTVVIVVADHGESLGDHGLYFAHDFTLYDELVHVPLILRAPGVAPARHRDPVSLVDVLPTLCSLLSLACETDLDGLALPIERARGERTVFARSAPARERYARNPWLFVNGPEGRWSLARRGNLKLLLLPHPDGPRREGYDLSQDPDERRNIWDASSFADLEAELLAWRSRSPKQGTRAGERPQPLDPDTVRELRSFGYLD